VTWRRLAFLGYAALLAFALVNTSCRGEEAAASQRVPGAPRQRIITIGGPITETVYALGLGDQVVATDTSSTYPAAVEQLPKVGYQRSLTAETVLAFRPDLVIASPEAGPASTLAQLRAAGVKLAQLGEAHDGPSAAARIRELGELLGRAERSEERRVGKECRRLCRSRWSPYH
jgi:iron complex transport system substrate-binding protein